MKLLVGYDGSNSAKAALALAVEHAKAFNAAIDVVSSMETGTNEETEKIRLNENNLKEIETQLKAKGIDVQTHLLIRGMRAGEDLINYAKDNGANGIYIGVKRRSKVGKLLFGSNATYIILNAPCPVTTVR